MQNYTAFEHQLHGKVTESEMQNDLIECIDYVIQYQIDEEVQQCTFLSVQINETTDVPTKEQLSVIIKLDRKDDVVERFLKVCNVSSNRTAPGINSIG